MKLSAYCYVLTFHLLFFRGDVPTKSDKTKRKMLSVQGVSENAFGTTRIRDFYVLFIFVFLLLMSSAILHQPKESFLCSVSLL